MNDVSCNGYNGVMIMLKKKGRCMGAEEYNVKNSISFRLAIVKSEIAAIEHLLEKIK